MAQDIELDAATKQSLADEVERLVRMGMDKKQARRIVWEDYLDELASDAKPPPPPEPEPDPAEPDPPAPVPALELIPSKPPPEGRFFTPERLARNRAKLNKVKQLIGIRSH